MRRSRRARARSFTLIFGALVNALGTTTETLSDQLRPVILWFCWLAILAFFVAYVEARPRPRTAPQQRRRRRRTPTLTPRLGRLRR